MNATNTLTILESKLQRMFTGERVVCSDADLDVLEQSHEVRSIPNPRQIGTVDKWLCWIG